MALSFLSFNGRGAWCHKAKFESWKQMEKDFTKVLTLFIGFLVSLSVRNWFVQVKMVPQLDSVLIQMNHFVWVDTSKNPNDFKVKMGLTPEEFRKTIIRYFLLSWTMCMSRMCGKMNEALGHHMNENHRLHQLQEPPTSSAQGRSYFCAPGYLRQKTTPHGSRIVVGIGKK